MRKEWNFFREKVLSFVGSFFDFLAGEQKKDFDEEGRESERHVCPKERKKDSPSLSLSLSPRGGGGGGGGCLNDDTTASTSSPTIRSLLLSFFSLSLFSLLLSNL